METDFPYGDISAQHKVRRFSTFILDIFGGISLNNWLSFAWTLHPATRRRRQGPIWLLFGSLICSTGDSWSVRSHSSEAAVKSSRCFLYRIFGLFGIKNTKCFSRNLIHELFKLQNELLENKTKNSSMNLIILVLHVYENVNYWCFPRSLCPMPQSAKCAGKSSDFRNTSAEWAYTIARTLGRLCERNVSFYVENPTDFTATWMCSINNI